MTVEHHAGRIQLVCDACDTAQPTSYERDEWDVMIADAKAAGWSVARVAGEWTHACPDCRAPVRRADHRQGRLL